MAQPKPSGIDLATLDVGDIIRHACDHQTYVVTSNYGDRVTAVQTVDVTNPIEWVLVSKVTQREKMS
jgi:hypothetical protein